MNWMKEMLRRVAQIFVGIFIFDCPGFQAIRKWVYGRIAASMGKKNVFSSKIMFYVPHGLDKKKLTVGNHVRISEDVRIDLSADVTLEDNVWISQHVEILNHIHSINGREWKDSKAIERTEGLCIGEDAWIGANVIILPKVTRIGKGAIVGAGSVVTRDIDDYAVAAGNPARQISQR